MGGRGSGTKVPPENDERYRAAAEAAIPGWWTVFTPWVQNHLNDPVLALQAAFADGFRRGAGFALKDGGRDES